MAWKACLISWIFIITNIWTPTMTQDVENMGKEMCEISLSSVFCEGVSGKFLPSDCSVHVKVMYITESNLSSLSADDFASLENLDTIYIDSCMIASGHNIFSLIKRLHRLEIINSNASDEVFNLLGSLKYLVKLSLESNKITRITKDILNSLTNVENTDPQHEEMSNVMNSSMSEMNFPPLRNAGDPNNPSVENNHLTRVKRQVFDRWSRLEEIDLSDNEISFIEADAFQGFTALRKVNTSYNMLERVGMRVFDDLPSLEEIDLSHNKITTIEADAFRGLSALRRLDLSHNELSGDFDMASLSLPAGCVFQGLVASCPGQPMGGDPPGEDQRPAQEATTDDPQQQQQQQQTEQREEQHQRQIERQEWKEVKELLEQQQGAVRLLVEEVQRQRNELEQREHQRQAERQEWKEVKELLEQQQGAVRLLVEEVQGQRKEQQQREQQRRAERQESKEVKELLTECLRRHNANEGHAPSAAFGRDLWEVNLVNVLNFLLLLILLILVCLLVTSRKQVQGQRDEEKSLRSWNR